MNPLTRMLTDLDPNFDGAACVGDWDLFDVRDEKEPAEHHALRAEYARAICRPCPVLERCHETAMNMRATQRTGTWAGITFDHRGRPARLTEETR